MAGHAFKDDRTAEVLLTWIVVAWAHLPISTHFAVPTHREFNELAFIGSMQVCPRVVTRSNHIVDLHLFQVCIGPLKADLVALLIKLAFPFDNLVIPIRGLVVERVVHCEVFDSINIISAMKGAPHTGLPVGLRNVPMAMGAGRRIHITEIHLLCVRYRWTLPRIERRGAKSCRSGQKADGLPLSGLTPSDAHADMIVPKELLGSMPKARKGGKWLGPNEPVRTPPLRCPHRFVVTLPGILESNVSRDSDTARIILRGRNLTKLRTGNRFIRRPEELMVEQVSGVKVQVKRNSLLDLDRL